MISSLKITAALLLCFFSIAQASDFKLKYQEMGHLLDSIQNSAQLPERALEPDRYPHTQEEIPAVAILIFRQLEKVVFGRQGVIELKACKDCAFMAKYASKAVFVQPSEVKKIFNEFPASDAKIVLAGILAHELSHFVQEASIGMGAFPGLSINGFKSLYMGSVTEPNTDIKEIVQQGVRAHAEVDAYGFLILRRAGFAKPTPMLEFLELTLLEQEKLSTSDNWVGLTDLKFRIAQDKIVLDQLYPHVR
jgi:hypothetical protein